MKGFLIKIFEAIITSIGTAIGVLLAFWICRLLGII